MQTHTHTRLNINIYTVYKSIKEYIPVYFRLGHVPGKGLAVTLACLFAFSFCGWWSVTYRYSPEKKRHYEATVAG